MLCSVVVQDFDLLSKPNSYSGSTHWCKSLLIHGGGSSPGRDLNIVLACATNSTPYLDPVGPFQQYCTGNKIPILQT